LEKGKSRDNRFCFPQRGRLRIQVLRGIPFHLPEDKRSAALVQMGSTRPFGHFKLTFKLGMVVHPCHPSTREAEAKECGVRGQPELHRETKYK
jgi:hypothetical protein